MEFSPRAAELTTLLESRITNFYTNFQVDEIGRVVSVGDGIARVHNYMTDPSVSAGQEVLQGIPVHEIGEDVLSHPFYCSSVVHIPGEIFDPQTISNLTHLNHLLIHLKHDFNNNVIQPGYIQSLQRELNHTPAELLSGKLDVMLHREYNNLYHYWYLSGAQSPLDLCREYANWCHYWYIRTVSIHSPLEPFHFSINYQFLFSIISVIAILCLFLFWHIRNKKRKNKKCEESKP
uniref:Uncharacterized protein n=1 Tax=Mirabilis jalapa TaxID=3538 RepID=A0A7T7JNU6_MIRJA|nr:hypothetical protein KYW51_mgp04 [Mirabilis jalapa]QQL93539.1 hypothetical protein [Mirabilis jalapa]